MASNTIKAQVAASPRAAFPGSFDMVAGSTVLQLGSSYTVANSNTVIINFSGGTLTVALPDAASYPYRHLFFCNKGGGAINADASVVGPLAGGAQGTAICGAGAGKWAHLVSNSGNWEIIGGN